MRNAGLNKSVNMEFPYYNPYNRNSDVSTKIWTAIKHFKDITDLHHCVFMCGIASGC